MRTNIPHSSSASDTLEDNGYELLGESAYLSEGDTVDSIASLGGHTPDDTSSIAETEESDDESQVAEADTVEASYHSQHTLLRSRLAEAAGEIGTDSEMTARPTVQSISSSIEFEEQKNICNLDAMIVRYGVARFEEENIPQMFEEYNASQIELSLQQTISRRGMDLRRPFHILYYSGSPRLPKNNRGREEVISKVASALAAGINSETSLDSSKGPARYNVYTLPTYGSSPSSSEVELIDSTGIELVVEDYGDIAEELSTLPGAAKKFSQIDLAVFCHLPEQASEDDHRSLRQLRGSIEASFVPSLDVSLHVRPQDAPRDLFDETTDNLHMCIDYRIPGNPPHEDFEALPIPFDLFRDMDASQLNRHLAYLIRTRNEAVSRSWAMTTIEKFPPWSNLKLLMGQTAQNWNIDGASAFDMIRRVAWIFGVASVILVASLLVTSPSWKSVPVVNQEAALSSAIATFTNSTSGLSVPVLPRKTADIPFVSEKIAKAVSITPEKGLGSPMIHPFSPRANQSEKFKIHVIGDHHFVVTPPKQYVGLKKSPQVDILVCRGSVCGKDFVARISPLVEGVIAVELKREEAYGKLNVTVKTTSKPGSGKDLKEETLLVDFGSPWLKLSQYKATVGKLSQEFRSDISVLNSGFSNVTSLITTNLHSFENSLRQTAGKAVNTSHDLRSKARLVSKELEEEASKVSKELVKVSRQFKRNVRLLGTTCTELIRSAGRVDLGKALGDAPNPRKSKNLKKARKNALGLWSKVFDSTVASPKIIDDAPKAKKGCSKKCRRSKEGRR